MPVPFHARPTLVALSLLFAICFATPLWAQKDAGTIVGAVRDPSGAVVPGAKVTVEDVDRGVQMTLSTNDEGEYVASPLHIGRYKIRVEKTGFKSAVSEVVELNVQGRVAINIALQVGQISEEMLVTGAAPLLETETSELGQVVDQKRVSNLPLNGRNFAQLALLSTGTAPSEPGARDEGGYGFSANGARSLDNNFLLDGVDNNSNLPDLLNEANYVVMPPPDALQEFKVETGNYDAEFGRSTGAIVNATTKGGSNAFHGSVYEFLRNQSFDAMNYFDTARQPYHQNQFGATLGGRIIRDKLLFFVDYQGLRMSQAQTTTSVVPTAAERGGDFSNSIDLTAPTGVLDCNGQQTYQGELFDTR